jgi:hypothetical protein
MTYRTPLKYKHRLKNHHLMEPEDVIDPKFIPPVVHDATLAGEGNAALPLGVVVSPAGGNHLQVLPDGLYATGQALSAILTQSIDDGDAGHAPSGNAVFDALVAVYAAVWAHQVKQYDGLALSDLATALVAVDGVGWWLVPCDCTLNEVITAVTVAQSSSGSVTVDAKLGATSLFATLPSIQASEDTSLTGTPAVIETAGSINVLSKGDIVKFNLTAAGTGAKGLQARIVYTPS